MRVQLFCICSLLALAFADDDYLAPHGITEDTFIGTDNTITDAIDFPFLMNGVQMNSIRISTNGAVFPSVSSVEDNVAPTATDAGAFCDFSASKIAVLGPLWGNLHIVPSPVGTSKYIKAGLYYRVMTNQAQKDSDFLREWGKKVSIDSSKNNINPVSGLVVTWWQMRNPSATSGDTKYINAQLIIIIDINDIAWAFYNYGSFQWAPAGHGTGNQIVDLRIGYATMNGSPLEYYNSPVSGTNNVATQSNFYFKLSADPRVDTTDTSAYTAGTVTTTSAYKYIGQSFVANVDSNGPTAFNFRSVNVGGSSSAYATSGSTLVCFKTAAYTGAGSALKTLPATTKNFFARSVVANAAGVWQFGAQYKFKAGITYYCYVDTALAAGIQLVTLTHNKRTPSSSYNTASTFSSATSTKSFAYQFQSILFGNGMNDPIFTSLHSGENYVFKGEAGKAFNIYHDEWTNLNAEFKFSNAANQEGTVMDSVGFMAGGHKISFAAKDFAETTLTVTLDGKQVKLVDELVHLSGCVDVHYKDTGKGMYFYIVTPSHVFKFWHNVRHTEHIDGSFINLMVEDVPVELSKRQIGGVLGQTAFGGPINLENADFAATGLFGEESSRFFKSTEFNC